MIATSGIYNTSVVEAESITEPVLLADAKAWMKVDYTDDDDLIDALIVAARQDIENYCGIKLVNSSVVAYVSVKDSEEEFLQFPFAIREMIDQETLDINYLSKGSADEPQTIDEDFYFSNGISFTGTGKYRIEYDVDVAAVPETIKEAIKMLVAYRYNNRGDQEPQLGIPEDVRVKIHKYKQIWL